MSLIERWDYQHELMAQLPPASLRVIYSRSGAFTAAALLQSKDAIVNDVLYWASVGSKMEAEYLLAVLNSETVRGRVENLQSRGQWGARHFHRVMLELPIPKYNSSIPLHVTLAEASKRAEEVTATVPLREGEHFVRVRGRVREALRGDGIAQRMDELVKELLSH